MPVCKWRTYSVQVSENVQLNIWASIDREGRTQYSRDIRRVNPKDDTKPFRTFWPQHLLEVPEALVTASQSLAAAENVNPELRQRLTAFSAAMDQIHRSGKVNGRDAEANGKSASVLAL